MARIRCRVWSPHLVLGAIGCAFTIGCGAGQGSGEELGGSAGSSLGGASGGGRSASGGTGATGTGGGASATGGSTAQGMTGGASTGGTSGGGVAGDSAGGAAGRIGGTGGAAGRGSSGGTSGGAGGAFQAAAHPSLPQVVDLGGPVLTAPKVLPIIYASDTGSSDVKAFLQEYAASATWAEQTSEYGVGPLTVLPAVTATGTAPKTISDATLQAMIGPNTSGTKPGWGQLDAHTIYMFVMPEGTLATESNQTCCTEFDGYHSEAKVGSTVVPYAVVCSCPSSGPGPGSLTTLQGRTVAMSHELVESATDPYPNTNPAFTQEDDDDIVWTLVTGGEVGDMCEFNDDANLTPDGAKYMIQRTWSNAAAARGQSPCVPVKATTPYLNSFPALDRISDGALGRGFSTLGLSIPIGQKKTIPLTLSSAEPTGATWKVQVFDYDLAVAGTAAGLSLSLDKSSGRNGDTLHLTITPKAADPQIGGEAFLIVSTYGAPGDAGYETQLTMGLVTN